MNEEIRQLILQAQDGDTDAFHKLVAMHDHRIMALAYQLTKNKQDAEDLYQEVFMKAYKKLHQFQFRSEFYTWLYRITVNTAFNLKRKLSRFPTHEPDPAENRDPMDWIISEDTTDDERMEIIKAVRKSMEILPQQQRTVFILKHLQSLKIKDIASILNISEGTVKKYLFRAMEKLRMSLKEYQYAR
ncbi:MAG: sigma-70 family RNA polymerase sigma factor [FCB group bacterium]|nr:sigma-70 family RNA polymerase sigma factor [FCB group bacterium]